MLYLIGLGLNDEKDITVKGLEAIKKCDKVFLEHYTSLLTCTKEDLEKFYGKSVILADRNLVEKDADQILEAANNGDAAFLVVGDIFGATTHTDLVLRAKEKGIAVEYIHNASILNAVGSTGLELYKFGKTTSMVFFDDDWRPKTAYDVVKMNQEMKLHTLVLLDIKVAEPTKEDLLKGKDTPQEPRFMSVGECIKQFLEIEEEQKENILTPETKVIGLARVGSKDMVLKYGSMKELIDYDFGKPLHSLIIPSDLQVVEEEFLATLE